MPHLGEPPLVTPDADWLRQIWEQPVELPKYDWLDVFRVSVQMLQTELDTGVDDEGRTSTQIS